MTELQTYITSYFGITNENLDAIASLFDATTVSKGDYFNKSGHYCKKLSFVKNGYFRVFGYASNDKEITQWIASKGYFLTDVYSFYFQQPARWNIQALCDCELYTIRLEDYQQLSSIVPNWPTMEKQFMAKCFTMLEDRVFSHLSQNAEERYNALFEHNKELFNQVSLHYIASMLGMSPETLSRIRKRKN